jgi:signal transduction histidine kinase/putative methionine-R-sulfoxide reductase with GAF domain
MRGLYSKIMLLVGGVFTVVMVIMLLVVYATESREIQQEGLKRAEALNRMAFEALYASMRQGGGREGNHQVIARLQEVGAFTHLAVVKGEPVVRQFGAEPDELPQDDLERQAVTGIPQQQVRWEDGYRVVRYVMPVRVRAECQRCHHAEIGAINGAISTEVSLREYESALRRRRNILLLTVVGGLAVLSLLTFYGLHRLVIRPVQVIRQGAAAVAQGDLGYRLQVRTGDELEDLASEFNYMASQLQESYTNLEEKVEERTRELAALNQIAESVNRSLNLEETLPPVLDHVLSLCDADAVDIRILEENALWLRACRGLSEEFQREDGRIALGQCLCGAAARDGQPQMVPNLREARPEALPCLSGGFLSSLAVPIMAKEQVVGVIHVAGSGQNAFHARHEAFLTAVGQHVGLAIEKARLYEGERSQRQLAETLRRVSQTLSASLDMSVVLHTLLQQLAEVLTIDVGLILLREGDELRVESVRGRSQLKMDRLLGYRFPISASRDFQQVIREKRVLTFCEPGRQPPFSEGFRRIEEVDWCMVVPLLWGDEVVGLLAMEQLEHCYDEDEEPQIALAFANNAVMAIENARLYAEISALNEELESRVQLRTQELEEAKEALDRQAHQLRHLLNKTIRIQEEERDRIAHDIHDGISQLLMGALYETQAAKVSMLDRPEVAQEKLQTAQNILKQVKAEMRRIIYDLHPAILSESGLVPALEALVEDYQAHTGVHCTFTVAGQVQRLLPEQERAIYRIVQEALHNVSRHAGTDEAHLTIAFNAHEMQVTIEDQGQGFHEEGLMDKDAHRPLGLVGMKERAQSIGGDLLIETWPGQGTRVTARVSVEGDEGAR